MATLRRVFRAVGLRPRAGSYSRPVLESAHSATASPHLYQNIKKKLSSRFATGCINQAQDSLSNKIARSSLDKVLQLLDSPRYDLYASTPDRRDLRCRSLLLGATEAGLARARAAGRCLGRPRARAVEEGLSIRRTAKRFGVSPPRFSASLRSPPLTGPDPDQPLGGAGSVGKAHTQGYSYEMKPGGLCAYDAELGRGGSPLSLTHKHKG
jgi:hypothetical protein